MKRKHINFLFILALLLLAACERAEAGLPQEEPSEVKEKSPSSVWVAPYLPKSLSAALQLPETLYQVEAKTGADFWIDVGADHPLTEWVYVLAAPFPTVTDELRLADLRAFWAGEELPEFPVSQLIMDGNTKGVLEKLWGNASLTAVKAVDAKDLLSSAWEGKAIWAILPWEDLQPRWKVIALDGQSPLHKSFNANAYGLKVPFSIFAREETGQDALQNLISGADGLLLPASNRDAGKLTTVVLTGVTALVRATASTMERKGMTYPAIDIGDMLRDADILHISNEIPFTATCPKPGMNRAKEDNLIFCSRPDYIQLLEAIGTDVIELTGDHFRDWGADAMRTTLEMYNERSWPYYGGGMDIDDAMQPVLFEHNGNKIAFIGCNAKPRGYSTVSATTPGALHCDMEAMAEVVQDVIAQGYLPIFTFQHLEYYAYYINKNLVDDFEKAAAAGAVIVSGSQAHQPHGFQFYRDATLHYGLGNLFFDQFNEGFPMRQAFIDRHVFYDGRYISTELITIMFIDYARPRYMTADERLDLLSTVFSASGWK